MFHRSTGEHPYQLMREEEGGGAGSLDGGGDNGSNDASAGAVDMGDLSGSISANGPAGPDQSAGPGSSQTASNDGTGNGGGNGTGQNGPFSSGPVNLDTAATNQTLAPGQTVTMTINGFAAAAVVAATAVDPEVGVAAAAAAAAINIANGMSASFGNAMGTVLETPGGPATVSNMSIFETASVYDTNNYGDMPGASGLVTETPSQGAYGYPGGTVIATDNFNHAAVAFDNGAFVSLG